MLESTEGKSRLLIGLGASAAEAGFRVKYTLATRLVNELVEGADEQTLTKTIARYGRVDLLCIDELLSQESAKSVLISASSSAPPTGHLEIGATYCLRRSRRCPTLLFMSALASPKRSSRAEGSRAISRGVRWLTACPVVAFLSLIAELIYLGWPYWVGPDPWRGAELWGQVLSSIGVLAWNASVPVALVVLVLFSATRLPLGLPVAAVTCVLFSGTVVAAMVLLTVDDSSTGVLLLLFLPVELLLALLPFIGLTFLVNRMRERRSPARSIR